MQSYSPSTLLGEGAHARVHLATHKPTGTLVALKTLTHPVPTLQHAAALPEVRALSSLPTHPNVCSLYEVIVASGTATLVLQYLGGGDLHTLCRRGQLLPERCVAITTDILRGLAFLHAHGVIHRDLKPENVLLDTDGTAVLADLGCAVSTSAAAQRVTPYRATRWFRAPEMLLKCHAASPALDVYACAMVSLEMLLGVPMVPGASEADCLRRLVKLQGGVPVGWSEGAGRAAALGLQKP